MDAKIDVARDRLLAGSPRTALEILDHIDAHLDRARASARTIFRLLTNRSCCHLELGNDEEGVAGFEAAYQLQPDDPKAKANLALARLIRGRTEEAERIAREILRQDPARADALTVLVQVLSRQGELEQAIEVLRPYSEDRGVRDALAMILLRAGRYEEVEGVLSQVPTDGRTVQETLFLAEAYVGIANRYLKEVDPYPSRLPAEISIRVKSVEHMLAPVVEQARREISIHLLPALALRAGARFIIGLVPQGIQDLEEASSLTRVSHNVLRNLGLFYTAHGNFSRAAATFRRALDAFPDQSCELRPLLAEALLANGQPEEALREADHVWTEADSPETRCAAGLVYAAVSAAAGDGARAEAVIGILKEESPDNLDVDLAWAEVLGRLGRHEEATGVLEGLVARAEGGKAAIIRMNLADAYGRQGRFNDAANVYRDVAHPIDYPDTFRKYLVALYRSDHWAEALEAASRAREVRGGVWPPVEEAEIEGVILERLGDLPRARRLYEAVLSSRGFDSNIKLRLAEVLLRADEVEAAKASLDAAVEGSSRDARGLLRAGQLYSAMGEVRRALRCAYEAVTLSPHDPDASIGFITMMFGVPDNVRAELDYEAAAPGCTVQVEINGATHRFRLLEEGEVVTGPEDLHSTEPLATRLLGRRTGESVVLQEGPPLVREGVVRAIHHKYVAKFQDMLAQHPIRYAERGDLIAIPVREGQLDQVRAMVHQRADHTRRLFDAYKQMPLTIGAIATMFGKTAFETLLTLAQEPDIPIISRNGSPDAERRAREILANAETIVLDPTALATLALLNLAELPRQLGVRVVVPQLLLDELYLEILKRRAFAGREYMVLSAEGDVLTRRTVTPEQHEMGTQVLARAREAAKSLHVSPRPAIAGRWSDWGDREILGPDSADAVAIAQSSGAVLVSADGRLMGAVRNTWGTRTASVHDFVEHCARKGYISDDVLEEATTTLVGYGFTYIPVRGATLIHAIRGTGYEPSTRWAALLNVLADPETSEQSAIRVVGDFLVKLDQRLVIPPSIERLIRDSLEAVVRHRTPRVLQKVQQYVSANPGLSKVMQRLIHGAARHVERSITEGRMIGL